MDISAALYLVSAGLFFVGAVLIAWSFVDEYRQRKRLRIQRELEQARQELHAAFNSARTRLRVSSHEARRRLIQAAHESEMPTRVGPDV